MTALRGEPKLGGMKRLLLLLPLLLAPNAAFAFWGNQEPWATPKGDARVDCAVWKAKSERHDKLRAIEAVSYTHLTLPTKA